MNVQLSREALSVLELLPQWQLRPHLQPASAAPWGIDCNALLVLVAASQTEQRLWANLGKAMQAMGVPQAYWSQAHVMASEHIEQALQRVLQEKPRVLVIFGESLKKALMSLQPALEDQCAVRCVEPLVNVAKNAQHKRALFELFAALKPKAQ